MTTRQKRFRLRIAEDPIYSDATFILTDDYGQIIPITVYDTYIGADGATYLRVGVDLTDGLYAAPVRDAGLSDEWLAEHAAAYQMTRAAIARPSDRPSASGSYRKPEGYQGNPAASSGRWRKPGGGKQPNHSGRRW